MSSVTVSAPVSSVTVSGGPVSSVTVGVAPVDLYALTYSQGYV